MFRSLGKCVAGLHTPGAAAQGDFSVTVLRPHLQNHGINNYYRKEGTFRGDSAPISRDRTALLLL